MNKPTEEIKTEYNNLVKNVEQLKSDVNYLDNFISKMNNPEIQSPTLVKQIQEIPEIPEIPKETVEIKEENKEDLLEALTEPEDQNKKSNEEILQEQKEEMNDRKTNIENALMKMAQNIKNADINQHKTQAWDMLKKTNKELEDYLSTILFYDIKRNWATYGQQLWYRPEYYLNMFLQSYNDLNLHIGRNQYYKDIMRKHLNKETLPTEDLQFISIKNQIDDAYNGIVQMKNQQKGGRKTRKHRKQSKITSHKTRKPRTQRTQRPQRTMRRQRKSHRKQ